MASFRFVNKITQENEQINTFLYVEVAYECVARALSW
jgi:hypothetical protein